MATPRDIWSQMQPETPISRYPVPNPQPSPGIAGLVQSIGQGVGNALAYRRQLEAQVQAAAAKVAEMEAKQLQEAAAAAAEREAKRALEFDLLKERNKGDIELEKIRAKAGLEKVGALKKAGAYNRRGADDGGLTPAQKAQQNAKVNAMWGEKTKAFKASILGLAPSQRTGSVGGQSYNPEYSLTAEQRGIRDAVVKASQLVLNGASPDEAMDKTIGNLGKLTATTYLIRPKGIKTVPIHDAQGKVLGYQTERGMGQERALQIARDYLEELAIGRDNISGEAIAAPAAGIPDMTQWTDPQLRAIAGE